jgi:uncharacterized protein
MRNFSLLVKPASFSCNLRCNYCFYLEKEKLFKGDNLMTDKVLERMISSFMEIDMPAYSIGWQGGEPTMMGLDFFRQVVKYQAKYGRSGATVSNGLQTNGTRLDDEWCRHLTEYNFLVGLSIDGPKEIHDKHRWTVNGAGSHGMVMRGLDALKRNHTEFNVLTLVSDSNVEHPLVIYNYLKDLGVKYHQYIECVEFMPDGTLAPFAVRPEQWGEFLCTIFDEWYSKDRFDVSVRFFDSIITKMVDGVANACVFADDCRQYLVVEHDGGIYPCDFFVLPEWKLGNIMDGEWNDFLESPLYEKFGGRKSQWNGECEECPYLKYCLGCCPKNRLNHGKNPRDLSALCAGWKMFYEHTLPRFKSIANYIRKERRRAAELEEIERNRIRAAQMSMQPKTKVGRNDPCPCGSGKKYKKCCGRNK